MFIQSTAELGSRDLRRAEPEQMPRDDLAVKQIDIIEQHLPGKAEHGKFRGVVLAAEHRFAEENATDAQPVKSPDEPIKIPDFHRVSPAACVQLFVGGDHFGEEPSLLPGPAPTRAG